MASRGGDIIVENDVSGGFLGTRVSGQQEKYPYTFRLKVCT